MDEVDDGCATGRRLEANVGKTVDRFDGGLVLANPATLGSSEGTRIGLTKEGEAVVVVGAADGGLAAKLPDGATEIGVR